MFPAAFSKAGPGGMAICRPPSSHLPEPQLYPSGPQKRSHKQLHKAQAGILNKGLLLVPEALALEECLVGTGSWP